MERTNSDQGQGAAAATDPQQSARDIMERGRYSGLMFANLTTFALPPLDGHACFKGTSIWQFTPCFANARATLPPSS